MDRLLNVNFLQSKVFGAEFKRFIARDIKSSYRINSIIAASMRAFAHLYSEMQNK